MSFEATEEQDAIIQRIKDLVPAYEGRRVYDYVPDEQKLERDADGLLLLDYAIVTFGALYPTEGDRTIEGAAEQPLIMPIIVENWTMLRRNARVNAGSVRVALRGWAPHPDNAAEIELRGGAWFDKRDSSNRPIRWMESVTADTVLNQSIEQPEMGNQFLGNFAPNF